MFKSRKIWFMFGVALVIIGLVFLSVWILSEMNAAKKPWSVVYLSTGKVYIAKVIRLPRWQLVDAYALEVVPNPEDPQGANFQLIPVQDAIWAPQKLYVNQEQVILYGPLREDSRALEAIRKAGQ